MRWEDIRDKVILCAQPVSEEKILKRNFLDFEVYIRVIDGNQTSKLNADAAEILEIPEKEIFKTARQNLVDQKLEWSLPRGEDIDMLSVSRDGFKYGGFVGFQAEVLNTYANEHKGNIVVLPSSIHDNILVPQDDVDLNDFHRTVREVNEEQVAESERLSDHAYLYIPALGQFYW